MAADVGGLVERLGCLDSCAVSDALDGLGLQGAVAGITCLSPPQGALAGSVLTVDVGPRETDEPTPHLASGAIEAGGPGQVIVVGHHGRTDVSAWGGLLSQAALQRGVEGVVVDGALRDVDESRALEFPVFGRAAVPISARRRIVERSWGAPIQFAGVPVDSGDLVIADASGVVFVPRARAGDVVAEAERITRVEASMAAAVRGGKPISEVMHDRSFEAQEQW